jgi:hypothetical protein
MKKLILLIIFFAGMFAELSAQRKADFIILEDSIVALHQSMIAEPNIITRYQKNEELLLLLEETLRLKNSFSHPFSSLQTISVLTSKDKKLRIFTWYLINNQKVYEHFGFIQTFDEENKEYKLFSLTDKWSKILNPEGQMLTCNNWYGALYTDIIEMESSTKTYYTLLGWNGGTVFSQQKLIEIITINKKGIPSFGANIFRGYSKARTLRIVFEYAKNAHFTLAYDMQSFAQRSATKDKKTRKYWTDTTYTDMIVFNQLIPMDESLAGISQFMVPEASLNSGFIQKDGKWVFKPDVIATNVRGKVSKKNPPPPPPKRENKTRKLYTPVE